MDSNTFNQEIIPVTLKDLRYLKHSEKHKLLPCIAHHVEEFSNGLQSAPVPFDPFTPFVPFLSTNFLCHGKGSFAAFAGPISPPSFRRSAHSSSSLVSTKFPCSPNLSFTGKCIAAIGPFANSSASKIKISFLKTSKWFSNAMRYPSPSFVLPALGMKIGSWNVHVGPAKKTSFVPSSHVKWPMTLNKPPAGGPHFWKSYGLVGSIWHCQKWL